MGPPHHRAARLRDDLRVIYLAPKLVEALDNLKVALGSSAHDPLQPLAQSRRTSIKAIAKHVNRSAVIFDAHLNPAENTHARARTRRKRLFQPRERVMIRQRERCQPL